jgi:hypothetical protein
MPLLLDVRSLLRRHREEKAGDLYTLARRLAANESIEPSAILETLEASGADDDALADAVELVERRNELRRVEAQGPAAEEELVGLRDAIAKHKAELDAAEAKYRRAVGPLATSEEAAQARATSAAQARSALLHPGNLPPSIYARLETNRRELLAAGHVVNETRSKIARQERRVEDGLAILASEGGEAKCSRLFDDPASRVNMRIATQQAVTDTRGGRHQIPELQERLKQAIAVSDAAQAAFDEASRAARDF